MAAIEFFTGNFRDRRVSLDERVYTIGSDAESVELAVKDPTVSRVHAGLERVGTSWLVRDLGSRNGTRVNGDVLLGQHRLRDNDEILVGRTRLVFRDVDASPRPTTDALAGPPANITKKEKQVLIELCRPLLSLNAFQPPASVREIAAKLFIGKNAVQMHLTNLYVKFGIYDDGDGSKLVRLANEAVQRGAVTLADLRPPKPTDEKGEP